MARKATGAVVERKRKRGRVYALRFSAYGQRQYVTLGDAVDGWTRKLAEAELEQVLAQVKLRQWQPPEPEPERAAEPERRDPMFHEFASEWFAAREGEWNGRTAEDYRWSLTHHLLPYFARRRLSEITVEDVDRYRAHKVREGRLAPNTINKTLTRLSQLMEVAIEYGYVDRNPARGKRRRCKPHRPRRASMGAEQVDALLRAAGRHRTLLATAIMAGGLRVSEVTGLRWRDVNLAAGTLTVARSKTDAGVRVVELEPGLLDELKAYKQASPFTEPDHYVFYGRHRKRLPDGTLYDGHKRRDRAAVARRVLHPAIERANVMLEKAGRPTISADVTFHSLRRTFASIAAEAGVDPAWTTAQIGHADAAFTISVYTDVQNRRESPASRIGKLIRGDSMGTSAHSNGDEAADPQNAESPEPASGQLNSAVEGA